MTTVAERRGEPRVAIVGDCWVWSGAKRQGYATIKLDGRAVSAHRVVFTVFKGSIPDGLTVDHLCFNRACLNPDHLRLLTMDENRRNQRSAHQTHCINGHAFDAANTRPRSRGHGRECRACNRDRAARRRAS